MQVPIAQAAADGVAWADTRRSGQMQRGYKAVKLASDTSEPAGLRRPVDRRVGGTVLPSDAKLLNYGALVGLCAVQLETEITRPWSRRRR